MDATGRLADEAVERTLACLRELPRGPRPRTGSSGVRVAATSAARDAANRDEFFDAVEDVVGVRPELLTGDDEGRMSFLGATGDLDPARGPFLVVDIGGGSTEFILGTDRGRGRDVGRRGLRAADREVPASTTRRSPRS